MMVYTDGKHLIADTPEQLHGFAASVGLKREWFQDHRHPHYDLTTARMVRKVLKAGAIEVSTRELVELSNNALLAHLLGQVLGLATNCMVKHLRSGSGA